MAMRAHDHGHDHAVCLGFSDAALLQVETLTKSNFIYTTILSTPLPFHKITYQ